MAPMCQSSGTLWAVLSVRSRGQEVKERNPDATRNEDLPGVVRDFIQKRLQVKNKPGQQKDRKDLQQDTNISRFSTDALDSPLPRKGHKSHL